MCRCCKDILLQSLLRHSSGQQRATSGFTTHSTSFTTHSYCTYLIPRIREGSARALASATAILALATANRGPDERRTAMPRTAAFIRGVDGTNRRRGHKRGQHNKKSTLGHLFSLIRRVNGDGSSVAYGTHPRAFTICEDEKI